MLRVVADANVLISAALARSPNAPSMQTLDAALDGRLELVTSPLLLRELASVLARPRLRKTSPATKRTGSSPTSPARAPCSPTRHLPTPLSAAIPTTTTSWRSRPLIMPPRSSPVTTTSSQSIPTHSKSRS
jgi:predicted nucleic acid-binding protein